MAFFGMFLNFQFAIPSKNLQQQSFAHSPLSATMKFQAFVAVTLALLQTGLSSALPQGASVAARDDKRGSEQVAGLGSRKQQVTGAGGSTMDLAIAMLETKNMGTDYPYGMSCSMIADMMESANAIMRI